jgi:hypothetical protein
MLRCEIVMIFPAFHIIAFATAGHLSLCLYCIRNSRTLVPVPILYSQQQDTCPCPYIVFATAGHLSLCLARSTHSSQTYHVPLRLIHYCHNKCTSFLKIVPLLGCFRTKISYEFLIFTTRLLFLTNVISLDLIILIIFDKGEEG